MTDYRALAERLADKWKHCEDDCYAAADAILALLEENDRLRRDLDGWEMTAKLVDLDCVIISRATLAEARLGKAVEALREASMFLDSIAGHGYGGMAAYEIARDGASTVLSELEQSE